jgi:hypothetical protein
MGQLRDAKVGKTRRAFTARCHTEDRLIHLNHDRVTDYFVTIVSPEATDGSIALSNETHTRRLELLNHIGSILARNDTDFRVNESGNLGADVIVLKDVHQATITTCQTHQRIDEVNRCAYFWAEWNLYANIFNFPTDTHVDGRGFLATGIGRWTSLCINGSHPPRKSLTGVTVKHRGATCVSEVFLGSRKLCVKGGLLWSSKVVGVNREEVVTGLV